MLYNLKRRFHTYVFTASGEAEDRYHLTPFYKWNNWGSGRLSNWLKDTETVADLGSKPDLIAAA